MKIRTLKYIQLAFFLRVCFLAARWPSE